MKKFDGRKKLYAKRVLMECVMMVLMLCGCSGHTVDNPFSKDTGYQVEMVKDQSDDKRQTVCDYKIFHKKDGLLMQDVYGDAIYGDIDGDGKCEAAFVTMEGSGIQRMCIYIADAEKEVAVSEKLDVMYDIFDIKGVENVGDIRVTNGQMKKNEIRDSSSNLLFQSSVIFCTLISLAAITLVSVPSTVPAAVPSASISTLYFAPLTSICISFLILKGSKM